MLTISNLRGAVILTQPNIPKPLHGLNPRTILGPDVWETTRQAAYAANDYCCFVCNTHKTQAEYHHWLEAHEVYEQAGPILHFTGVVALCHACHNFIHSGRLFEMYKAQQVSKAIFENILHRGFDLLSNEGLKSWYGTRLLWLVYQGMSREQALQQVIQEGYTVTNTEYAWQYFQLEIDGRYYKSLFANEKEWSEHYRGAPK